MVVQLTLLFYELIEKLSRAFHQHQVTVLGAPAKILSPGHVDVHSIN